MPYIRPHVRTKNPPMAPPALPALRRRPPGLARGVFQRAVRDAVFVFSPALRHAGGRGRKMDLAAHLGGIWLGDGRGDFAVGPAGTAVAVFL